MKKDQEGAGEILQVKDQERLGKMKQYIREDQRRSENIREYQRISENIRRKSENIREDNR